MYLPFPVAVHRISDNSFNHLFPCQVYKRLEEIVNNCSYMDWKHFDAGVIKVSVLDCICVQAVLCLISEA